MKILMTGATGMIGKELGKKLSQQGHQLSVISRQREKALLELPFACEVIEGDLARDRVLLPLQPDIVIHLMGESVDGRWTEEKKMQIQNSRITASENLCLSLGSFKGLYLTASAIGIYGDRGDETLTEESMPGEGFLAEVCKNWEEVSLTKLPEARRVVFRLGVVLHPTHGALQKMLMPFKFGVGGPLGGGRQFMSWIHIEDVVRAMLYAIEEREMSGVYNLVSPQPQTNHEFSRVLAETVGRPSFLPVPKLSLKLLLGEMSEIVLSSARVLPQKLLQSGFEFKYIQLQEALSNLLKDQKGVQEIFLAEQFLPYSIEKVFSFFSDAKNLESITPTLLNFKIAKMSTEKIEQGTRIDYNLKIHGVPTKWQTLIEDWNPPYKFVDTQVQGPYKLWHHTHKFETVPGGTLMTDYVRYQLPMGYLGWVGGILLVKKDVANIFEFRRQAMKTIKF